jgi:hypothetical protein
LDFQPFGAHFTSAGSNQEVAEMLYHEPRKGWRAVWLRIVGGYAIPVSQQRFADLDLLSMNGHLRRDLGLGEQLDLHRK